MVQYSPPLDTAFAALSDPTRRGILEHLGRSDASISDLAAKLRDHPHRPQEARAHPRAIRPRDEQEGRAGPDVPAGPAAPGRGSRVARQIPTDGRSPPGSTRRIPRTHERKIMTKATTTPPPAATFTTPSDREIRIERIYHATRDRVWRAFTDPALVAQWWGRGNRLVIERMERQERRALALRRARSGRRARLRRALPRGHAARASRPHVRVGRHARPTSSSKPTRSKTSATAAPGSSTTAAGAHDGGARRHARSPAWKRVSTRAGGARSRARLDDLNETGPNPSDSGGTLAPPRAGAYHEGLAQFELRRQGRHGCSYL